MHRAIQVIVLLLTACAAYTPSPSAQTSSRDARTSELAELRAEAERSGSVRVIVTLAATPGTPPSPDQIRSMQERLLAALRGTRHGVLHLYRSTPQLLLAVGRDALEVLVSSPLVVSVAADALSQPLKGQP